MPSAFFKKIADYKSSAFKWATTGLLAPSIAITGLSITPFFIPSDAEARNCGSNKLGVHRTIKVSRKNGFFLGTGKTGGIGLRPKEVVLTFDDGPRPGITNRILKALERECTKATFYVLGRAARANPKLLKRVAREGHTIASHTQSHPLLTKHNNATIEAEVRRGIKSINHALRGTGYKSSNFFRYPYLGRNKRTDEVVRKAGLVVFDMYIDSLDWKKTSPEFMLNRVLNRIRARGSGVVLFHDIQERTAVALPAFLRTLREEGYKVVHTVPGNRNFVYSDHSRSYREAAKAPRARPQLVALLEQPDHRQAHAFVHFKGIKGPRPVARKPTPLKNVVETENTKIEATNVAVVNHDETLNDIAKVQVKQGVKETAPTEPAVEISHADEISFASTELNDTDDTLSPTPDVDETPVNSIDEVAFSFDEEPEEFIYPDPEATTAENDKLADVSGNKDAEGEVASLGSAPEQSESILLASTDPTLDLNQHGLTEPSAPTGSISELDSPDGALESAEIRNTGPFLPRLRPGPRVPFPAKRPRYVATDTSIEVASSSDRNVDTETDNWGGEEPPRRRLNLFSIFRSDR